MCQAVIEIFVKFLPFLKRFTNRIDPYSKYMSSDTILQQGIYKDYEGNTKYTLLRKEKPVQDIVTLIGVDSMQSLYKHTLKDLLDQEKCEDTEENKDEINIFI
jgi:hypothetical protein